METQFDNLKFDSQGLIPAVIQDAQTNEVLTVAYMNRQSLERTIQSGETWFWSRSRNELWHKGATSGNTQRVVAIKVDCDSDSLVVLVKPSGPACHTGATSCFHNSITEPQLSVEDKNLGSVLAGLYELIESRDKERPEGSYTTYLFGQGLDKILKKVGEESAETIIAAKNEEKVPLIAEVSDLIYHLLVLLVARGVSLDEITLELTRRASKNVNGENA